MNNTDSRPQFRGGPAGGGWAGAEPSTLTRRSLVAAGAAASLGWLLPGCGGGHAQAPAPVNAACLPNARRPVASTDPAKAAAIRAIALDTIKTRHARAVLIRATVDGQEILTEAFGESGDGEPATVDMHFRNGSVAIALVSMLLLILVDEGRVSLDATVGRWLPDLPHGDRVTLRHLSQMTAGYADYVRDADFLAANLADPYRVWQPQELIAFAVRKPLFFEPGTNWAYSHTDYVILGLAIERITGRPMHELMQDKVLGPLCMTHTTDPRSPAITAPVLRAFTGERRAALGIAPGQPFYEESTLWDPSWTITQGAVQVTDLYDLHTSAIAFGSGLLLSPASHAAQVSTSLRGRTTFVDGCPTCFPHSERYAFGLGVVLKGNWILQPPLFGGYSAVAAYHQGRRVAIAAAVTYAPSAFDDDGENRLGNESETLFGSIARVLLPEDPPPARVPG